MEVTGAQRLMAGLLKKCRLKVEENVRLPGGEADLLLPDVKIIIELDGFFHLTEKTRGLDERKDRIWREAGYHVLRFANQELYQDPNRCIKQVLDTISALKRSTNPSKGETPLKNHEALENMRSSLRRKEKAEKRDKAWGKRHPEEYFLSVEETEPRPED